MARIDAKVGLVPEVPALSLLALVSLGVALLAGVLGRRGGLDERRVDDRPAAHHDAGRVEQAVELGEHRILQPVVLQDAPELEQRGRVGHLLAHEIDADKALHGARVEHGVLAALVGQVEPALQHQQVMR